MRQILSIWAAICIAGFLVPELVFGGEASRSPEFRSFIGSSNINGGGRSASGNKPLSLSQKNTEYLMEKLSSVPLTFSQKDDLISHFLSNYHIVLGEPIPKIWEGNYAGDVSFFLKTARAVPRIGVRQANRTVYDYFVRKPRARR